ncbi:transcriptional regulator, IclR family [Desulfosarcina variabilis str. Montpellier]|uniref:IclR family transcriptional regulator n=1 Tax=Desulfosarcina variabilis TaxID=2300 RepID=UPI003AFA9D92
MAKQKKTTPTDKYIVPAVEQAMRVLFRIAQSDSAHMNLTQICEQTGIHKSTAFCLLYTLRKYGIVQTEGRGKGYTLGPGLIGLSRKFLDTLSAPRLADPILADLAGKAGVTAALGLIADNNVFVAAKHEGGNPLGLTMRVGHRFPLTYGCHGKAICAVLPEAELDALLQEEKLYFHGDPSAFDRKRLMKEIAQCRRDGFADDLEETMPGLYAVAAPVIGPNQRPIGYIAVLGLASVEAVRQYGPMVAEAVKDLSRQLGTQI